MSVVIQVDSLSKQYRLGTIGGKRLVDDVNRWWARFRGQEDPLSKVGAPKRVKTRNQKAETAEPQVSDVIRPSSPSDTIYALRDVSFEVKQGEVLGIIGRNGAGKSTLLKVLSRVTAPTSGEVRVKGRIASLLEVGTGFHPELTGRENIFLNGTILGMTKAEIRSKLDEIVDFSGVEKFIDTPVKRYSSGMTVRLAFAVAAHLEPEILIVDEVLAVGDASFQKRCLGKMQDVAKDGRTILFVSHNMQAVRTLCSSGFVLEAGELAFAGTCGECVTNYESVSPEQTQTEWRREEGNGTRRLSFETASCKLLGRQPNLVLQIELALRSIQTHAPAFLALDILESGGSVLMQAIPLLDGFIRHAREPHHVTVTIHLPPLVPGIYGVTIWVGPHNTETFDEVRNCVRFEVFESPTAGRTFPHHRNHGLVVPSSEVEYSMHPRETVQQRL
jgi:lipopolysaccharide transport system ATP-binding protein